MKRPRNRAAILALLASAAALWPAFGQDRPESLLPPGFGEEAPASPAPPPPSQPGAPAPVDLLPPASLTPPADLAVVEGDAGDQNQTDEAADNTAEANDLPDYARRSIDVVGPLEQGFGLGADAFGGANGQFAAGLMRRIDAPIASRWAAILLRRALLSRVPTPRGIQPVDWVAERAWLLLRMGEADGARMLVQAVDVDRFDSRMYAMAAQVALATADPAGLCPLAANAPSFSTEPIWPIASAMCAALSGEASLSGAMIDQVRARRIARGIDLLLAEKVVGAGGGGRRAVTIQWDGVDRLSAWRFGLATATGVDIPQALFATVGPQVQAWRARAAMVPLEQRIGAARVAAALGVLSSANLVDLYGAFADQADPGEIADTDAGRLRVAYTGEDDAARIAALREIWAAAQGPRDRYAAAILTARAAARIAPSADYRDDSAALIGAMFAAGLDSYAARWGAIVDAMGGAAGDPAWAMLAVGAPRAAVDTGYSRAEAFVGRNPGQRGQMLVAALAGLGRIAPRDAQRLAEASGLAIAQQDNWSRAIERAARGGQTGMVAVLVAEAMQTPLWQRVPPRHFFHMISALDRVGLDAEARMIAAEAMSRL